MERERERAAAGRLRASRVHSRRRQKCGVVGAGRSAAVSASASTGGERRLPAAAAAAAVAEVAAVGTAVGVRVALDSVAAVASAEVSVDLGTDRVEAAVAAASVWPPFCCGRSPRLLHVAQAAATEWLWLWLFASAAGAVGLLSGVCFGRGGFPTVRAAAFDRGSCTAQRTDLSGRSRRGDQIAAWRASARGSAPTGNGLVGWISEIRAGQRAACCNPRRCRSAERADQEQAGRPLAWAGFPDGLER